jgi:pimeloyl-ACP methyl ester carboxylesterase
MFKGLSRAIRFGTAWKAEAPRVVESELEISHAGGTFDATLFLPEGFFGPLPGWVTLHGITRSGRKHPTLVRFVRALSASGAAVLVPEIPEWREMYLAPAEAEDTMRAAILALANREETQPGRLGAMGFSFGAPQALMAGTDPELIPHLRAVASFGGYFDLERTARFLFTGEHEWRGDRYRIEPDPYGRWVVGGNFLSETEEYGDTGAVAGALLDLARSAGDVQVPSWDPIHDTRKKELEAALPEAGRGLFRAFAPDAGTRMPPSQDDHLIRALAKAARGVSPRFDIGSRLKDIRVPVRLIHGRQDRLIPFSETLRMAEGFPPGFNVRVFLTGLFSHSQRNPDREPAKALREQLGFLRLMSVILGDL